MMDIGIIMLFSNSEVSRAIFAFCKTKQSHLNFGQLYPARKAFLSMLQCMGSALGLDAVDSTQF